MKLLRTVIVDDNAGFRRILKKFFRRYTFINLLAETESAEDTMKLLQELSPDLVTIDIHLPGMDGFEMASIVRKKYPDMKLIFISFNGNPAFQKKAEEMRCSYVAKERLMDELPRALEHLKGETRQRIK